MTNNYNNIKNIGASTIDTPFHNVKIPTDLQDKWEHITNTQEDFPSYDVESRCPVISRQFYSKGEH